MSEIKPYVAQGELCDDPQAINTVKAPANWLRNAISKGLSGLVVLHLEGGPSSETITRTATAWYHVIKNWPIQWDETLDKPRLTAAFLSLAGQSTRWPTPSQLKAALPARAYPDLALPKPEYPPEKAAANLAKIKEMIHDAIKKV